MSYYYISNSCGEICAWNSSTYLGYFSRRYIGKGENHE